MHVCDASVRLCMHEGNYACIARMHVYCVYACVVCVCNVIHISIYTCVCVLRAQFACVHVVMPVCVCVIAHM